MGRKIPTCFGCSYLEANNISLLINWLDPDGKYIVVAPDWLTLRFSDMPCTLVLFILYLLYIVVKKIYIKNRREEIRLVGLESSCNGVFITACIF